MNIDADTNRIDQINEYNFIYGAKEKKKVEKI